MRWRSRLALALLGIGSLTAAFAWTVGRVALRVERSSIERELSSAFGRDVKLGGELRIDLFPRVALEATDVSVANPPGSAFPELLRIAELRLALALWPLLRERLHVVGLELDGAEIRFEPSGDGRADALPLIDGLAGEQAVPESPIALRIDRFELRDARVAWLETATGEQLTVGIDSLRIAAADDEQPIEWSARGSLRGGRFELEGRGGSLAALLHPSGPWPLSLEGRAGRAELSIHGALERPTRLEGLDLEVELDIPDVGALLADEAEPPGLGRARVRGHLVDPAGEPGLDRVVVESDPGAELRVHLEGSVRRLSDPSGIEIDGELEADRLRCVEILVGRPLPEGRLRAKLALSDRDGTLGVAGEAHVASADGSLRVDLTGGFDDLRARDALDAQLRVAGPDLATLGRAVGLSRPLPAVGPVRASGRLRAVAGVVGIDALELEAGRRGETSLSLRGSLRDLRAFRGVSLSAAVGARSLAGLGRLVGLVRPLPDLGPLDFRATLADARGSLSVESFELRAGTSASVSVDVSGSLADVRELDALALDGKLRARDAAALGRLFDAELPAIGPIAFDGRVQGSDERFDAKGTASFGQTRLEGNASAELAGRSRPRVVAELRSPHLRLEDVGLGAQGGAAPREAEDGGPSWDGGAPLPFDELRRLDARIDLRADRVTAGTRVDVRDARVRIELEDGDLRLPTFALGYQGGRVDGGLRVDASTPQPALALRASATALDLAGLGVAIGQPDATGSGTLDVLLDLSSRGATPDALREALGGRAAFAARDWSAASALARRFLTDLTRTFVPELRRAPERLGCFRGAVSFAAGVGAVESLVLAGERATVVGAGSVDLVREQWHLELVPQVHDPGLLDVASAVRMTGPLAAPRFKPVPLDLVAGTLRGLARGALLPARTVTAGAQRMLGPVGKLLAPLHAGLGLGAKLASLDASTCVLPQVAAAGVLAR